MRYQFEVLRDGDRLYYENDTTFSTVEIAAIKATRLADIIRRNTDIITIQDSVFYARERDLVSVQLLPFQTVRTLELSAYPNPTQKYFTLKVNIIKNSKGALQIFNALGQLVREEKLNFVTGNNQLTIELDDYLALGVYTIVINLDGDRGSLKILKMGK
jgi:hypothetical protein